MVTQLLNFIRNNFFTVLVPILISLILFFFSPYYSSFFGVKKEISYALYSTENIMKAYKGIDEWSSLQTIFEGGKLDSAYLSSVIVKNTGSVPVERLDFDDDALITFGEDMQIIGARVEKVYPDNLEVSYSFSQKGIVFKGLLLNPGDSFLLEFLSKQEPKAVSMKARISGVGEPKMLDHSLGDGIYLSIAKHANMKSSVQRTLQKVNPFIAIFVSVLSILSVSVIQGFFVRRKFWIYILTFPSLYLGLWVAMTMMTGVFSMNGIDASSIYSPIIIIVISCVTGIVGVAIGHRLQRRYFLDYR